MKNLMLSDRQHTARNKKCYYISIISKNSNNINYEYISNSKCTNIVSHTVTAENQDNVIPSCMNIVTKQRSLLIRSTIYNKLSYGENIKHIHGSRILKKQEIKICLT